MRAVGLLIAILAAAAAGVAGASVVIAGPAPDPPPVGGGNPTAGTLRVGGRADDPAGGPRWAVRSYESQSGKRCVAVGRTDGEAVGPLDASGKVQAVDVKLSGSCADPGAEPLQVVLAQYGDTAGAGPRSVLFGVASRDVTGIAVTGPRGRPEPVQMDEGRAFAVVREGLSKTGSWTAIATLSDGTSRTYTR